MANYFLLHDGEAFETQLRPGLAACRQHRSFQPVLAYCHQLLPRVREFDSRHRIADGMSLIERVADGLPYQHQFWRALVGELLFYAAAEIPELPTCLDTLCILLPKQGREPSPILQAHRGSRPLTLGLSVYRPEHCGFNNGDDISRLAKYLASIDPSCWCAEDLTGMKDLTPDDREEELAIARDWFPLLCDLYSQASRKGQVIVHEIL
jgi:hypothetical protein